MTVRRAGFMPPSIGLPVGAKAVQIYTPLHPLDAALRRQQEHGKPVTIGTDVWIGGGAIIPPGDVFAAGNSCRVVRPIS